MVRGWMVSAVVAVATVSLALTAVTPAQADDETSYIVTVPDGKVAPLVSDLSQLGESPDEVYTAAVDGVAVTLTDAEVAQIVAETPGVEISPDLPVSIDATQTGATWGISSLDQPSVPADGSYTYPDSAGQGVDVFVIDTGVGTASVPFPGNIDASRAKDFSGAGSWYDCQGHGTHVAGTVGSQTYGVAKKATIVPVRVLDCSGSGTISNVIAGINWAILKKSPVNTAVINMSLGGGYSSALNDAVTNAVNAGIVVSVAAGNDTVDACRKSPASAPSALTVGSYDNSGAISYFSNFGACVDIYAPGSNVTSITLNSLKTNYAAATWNGTSMATPHAAGAAALYLSQNPTATPATVMAALAGAAVTTCPTCQPNVELNIRTLLSATPASTTITVPSAPGQPSASSISSDRATISWAEPSTNGGGSIDSYVLEYRPTSASTWSSTTATSAATSSILNGLSRSTTYVVRVSAHNSAGTGASSAEGTFTTSNTAPDAPSQPLVSNVTYQSAKLTWTSPANDGGANIDSFVVAVKDSSSSTWTTVVTTGTETSYVLDNLNRTKTYSVKVAARNSVGTSAYSSTASFTTLSQVASPPRNVSVKPATTTALATWQAPSDNGGSAVDYYTLEYKTPVDTSWTRVTTAGPVTSYSLVNLTRGTTYALRMTAHNSAGNSDLSATTTFSTLSSTPSTPRNVAAKNDGLTTKVTWQNPLDDGGATISGYVVQYKRSTSSSWTTVTSRGAATSLTLTGLVRNATYSFRVAAQNAVGTSGYTTPTTVTTPTLAQSIRSLR